MVVGQEAEVTRVPVQRGRILVAQNERLAATFTAAGFAVTTCGADDLTRAEVLEGAQPHLIIFGADDARPDAVLVCRRLVARTSALVVVLRSRSTPVDVGQLVASGADMVIEAPVGPGEAVARVRALFRRNPPAVTEDPTVTYGGLRIDGSRGLLLLGDVAIALPPEEAAALTLLIRNGGRVTRRAVLAAAFDSTEADLDAAVRRLRQRLETVEGWRRLVALRGVGFRLLEEPPPIYQTRPAATLSSGSFLTPS